MPQITGPIGNDGLPIYRGKGNVVNRIFRLHSRVAIISDSIGGILTPAAMRCWRNGISGYFDSGAAMNTIAQPSWTSAWAGSVPGAGILPEMNYSIANMMEAIFNGVQIPVLGSPAGLAARLGSDSGGQGFVSRAANSYPGADWVGGAALNCRSIYYTRSTGENGFIRNYARGSGSSSVERGTGAFVNLTSASPGYLADDFAVNLTGSEDLYVEAQGVEGATPTNGKCWSNIGNLVTKPSATTGIDYIPLSQGGWSVLTWLDTTKISAAAWMGILPLLNPTDAIIALTQNGSPSTANYQALKAQLRAAMPNIGIWWVSTHDTGTNLSNCQNCYAAADFSGGDDWINVHGFLGTKAQLDAVSFTSDGVHPTPLGAVAEVEAMQSLAYDLSGASGATTVVSINVVSITSDTSGPDGATSPDNLRIENPLSGTGVGNAQVIGYLTSEYDNDPNSAPTRGYAISKDDGSWSGMLLNSGLLYTIVARGPDGVTYGPMSLQL